MKKSKFLDTKIKDIIWANNVDTIMILDLNIENLRQAYNLTDIKLNSEDIMTNDVINICDALRTINSEVFYNSRLYNSLSVSQRYPRVVEYLQKDDITITEI